MSEQMTQRLRRIARAVTYSAAALLAATAINGQTKAAPAPPVTVYVFTPTDPSGLVDKPTTERIATVTDLKKRIGKLPTVRLVDRTEDARVTIEVLSSGAEAGGQTVGTTVVSGNVAISTPPSQMYLFVGRARLTSGTFKTEFDAGLGPFGRSIGENLGRKIEDWMKKNLVALQTAR